MGVVTLIMKSFGEEEVTVYDSMRRLRMAESLHINLPPTVERYFERNLLPNYYYHRNINTMATERGPGNRKVT